MAKVFKKGQRVTLITKWDSKGTFTLTPAVVYSCGAKQMVLTHATTGVELGRHYLPKREQYSFGLVIDASEDAEAVALAQAAAWIANEIADYEDRMARPVFADNSEAYKNGVRQNYEAMKIATPSVIYR